MVRHTTSRHYPWYAVPVDNKLLTDLMVTAVIDTLASLDLPFPTESESMRAELQVAREQFMDEP